MIQKSSLCFLKLLVFRLLNQEMRRSMLCSNTKVHRMGFSTGSILIKHKPSQKRKATYLSISNVKYFTWTYFSCWWQRQQNVCITISVLRWLFSSTLQQSFDQEPVGSKAVRQIYHHRDLVVPQIMYVVEVEFVGGGHDIFHSDKRLWDLLCDVVEPSLAEQAKKPAFAVSGSSHLICTQCNNHSALVRFSVHDSL